jgi:hypothetical protein
MRLRGGLTLSTGQWCARTSHSVVEGRRVRIGDYAGCDGVVLRLVFLHTLASLFLSTDSLVEVGANKGEVSGKVAFWLSPTQFPVIGGCDAASQRCGTYGVWMRCLTVGVTMGEVKGLLVGSCCDRTGGDACNRAGPRIPWQRCVQHSWCLFVLDR